MQLKMVVGRGVSGGGGGDGWGEGEGEGIVGGGESDDLGQHTKEFPSELPRFPSCPSISPRFMEGYHNSYNYRYHNPYQ